MGLRFDTALKDLPTDTMRNLAPCRQCQGALHYFAGVLRCSVCGLKVDEKLTREVKAELTESRPVVALKTETLPAEEKALQPSREPRLDLRPDQKAKRK